MKNKTSIIGILIAGLMVTSFAFALDCNKVQDYKLVSKSELQKIVDQKKIDDRSAFIVDVNSDSSFKKAHVPGAIHFGSNQKNFASLLPADKNTTIVAYCGGPACTAWHKAAKEACKLGYTHILHFKEGISGWSKN